MKYKSKEHLNWLVDKYLGYKHLPHKIRNRMKKDILAHWAPKEPINVFSWFQMFNSAISVLQKKSIDTWKGYK